MAVHPIFIHSLFRTGSTYVWNKFRQNKHYYCYSTATARVRHPRITKNHLAEYEKLLQPNHRGIPFFKKSFSFDDYCNNDPNPDLKRYIDYLISGAAAEGKTPVLQFNRTAFRIK